MFLKEVKSRPSCRKLKFSVYCFSARPSFQGSPSPHCSRTLAILCIWLGGAANGGNVSIFFPPPTRKTKTPDKSSRGGAKTWGHFSRQVDDAKKTCFHFTTNSRGFAITGFNLNVLLVWYSKSEFFFKLNFCWYTNLKSQVMRNVVSQLKFLVWDRFKQISGYRLVRLKSVQSIGSWF